MKWLPFVCLLIACTPQGRASDPVKSAPSDAATHGPMTAALPSSLPSAHGPALGGQSRLSRLRPVHAAAKRALCPLSIEPGVSIGGVELGYTMEDLIKLGLGVKAEPESTVVRVGATKAALLDGKVVDVWIDDVREVRDCITIAGKSIARAAPYETYRAAFTGCVPEAARTGGSFERCEEGGVFLGSGMGSFLQVRIRPRDPELTMENFDVVMRDNGQALELTDAVRAKVLETVLDARELSKYWHVDKPGRDVLRIVKTPLVPESPSFRMFGSPVQWVDAKPASLPYVEVTELAATSSKLTMMITFPAEGIHARAVFRPMGSKVPHSEWRVERVSVQER